MSSVELTPETVGGFDAIVIATNHACVDYGLLAKYTRLIVDTRNAMCDYRAELGDRLVMA